MVNSPAIGGSSKFRKIWTFYKQLQMTTLSLAYLFIFIILLVYYNSLSLYYFSFFLKTSKTYSSEKEVHQLY